MSEDTEKQFAAMAKTAIDEELNKRKNALIAKMAALESINTEDVAAAFAKKIKEATEPAPT